MNKKLLLVLVLTIVLFSCKKRQSASDYTNVIPANAAMVVSIDTWSMLEKGGVTAGDRAEFSAKVLDQTTGLNNEVKDIISAIITDPTKLGLSDNERLYIFTMQNLETAAVLASVSDRDAIVKTLQTLRKDVVCSEVTKGELYDWCVIADKILFSFNNSSLLMVENNDKSKAVVDSLFTLKADQSINSNEAYVKMSKQECDIEYMLLYDNLYKTAMEYTSGMRMTNSLDNFKDMYMFGSFNFEKGRLAVSANLFSSNSKTLKQLDENSAMISKIGTEFLKKLPAKSMMYSAFNINGQLFMDKLIENKEIADMVNDEYRNAIESIDGGLAIDMIGIEAQNPLFAAYVKVKNDALLQLVLKNKKSLGLDFKTIGDNSYCALLGTSKIYLGQSGDTFYLGSDESISKDGGKAVEDPLSGSKWASTIEESYSYLIINIEHIMQQAIVKQLLSMELGGKVAQFIPILEQFSYIEAYTPSKNEFKLNICTKSDKDNIMKLMIALVSTKNQK